MEKNYILVDYAENAKVNIDTVAVENLKRFTVKYCPFENYTLFDLLADFVKMYAWMIERNKKISLFDFIELLKNSGCEKAVVYGGTIQNIIGA